MEPSINIHEEKKVNVALPLIPFVIFKTLPFYFHLDRGIIEPYKFTIF